MKKLVWILVLALLTLPVCVFAQETGKPAPDFKLTDSMGKSYALSDLKGKYVVLEWLNYECPFVKKHYNSGSIQEYQKKYTDQGVAWFSINSSAEGKQGHLTAEAANRMIKEKNSNVTATLLDHDGKTGKAYGAKVTPHMFVINPEGVLIYAGAIDDNNSSDPDDAKTALNYVDAALKEAMSGKKVSTPSTDPYGCGVKYAS